MRTLALEQENAHLKEALGMRDTEVAGLRDKLASLAKGAGGNCWTASASEPAVLSGMCYQRLGVPGVCCSQVLAAECGQCYQM